MEELIQRGAEAEIYRSTWKGRPVVIKRRTEKSYRLPDIDRILRRQRTRQEALLLSAARRGGTATPIVYDVDLSAAAITMEYVAGRRVKDCIDALDEPEQQRICQKIGEGVAGLHRQDIVHGDITTSNLIMSRGRMYFIDFGLGEKSSAMEDRGVDLHLLMEAFAAAHRHPDLFFWVMEAYEAAVPWGREVQRKVADIAERGRYVVRE
ncbi:MAG: KEOPS complex kinase/ATPase Bud32 [Thermoplasmatota archaeon]